MGGDKWGRRHCACAAFPVREGGRGFGGEFGGLSGCARRVGVCKGGVCMGGSVQGGCKGGSVHGGCVRRGCVRGEVVQEVESARVECARGEYAWGGVCKGKCKGEV